MPNVAITIPAETCRKAPVWAAENDTAMTCTVREILDSMPRISAEKTKQLRRDNRREAMRAKLVMKIAKSTPSSGRISG
jgi:hypothetical protein